MQKSIVSIVLACCLLLFPVACTQNQINQAIANLQLGVSAASVAAPLVLAALAPEVAIPVTSYLGVANAVFGEVARIVASQLTSSQKAARIASSIAGLAAQDPAKVLPPNSPPQLQAEIGAVANAVKAIAGMFPSTGLARLSSRPIRFGCTPAQVAQLAAIQVQAQANLGALSIAARK